MPPDETRIETSGSRRLLQQWRPGAITLGAPVLPLAVFSAATGLAVSVAMLTVARVGAGAGKAVVTPTHSSLLADFYPPEAGARPRRRLDHCHGAA
jgi:MFS family permease